jgi:hypothetical protein
LQQPGEFSLRNPAVLAQASDLLGDLFWIRYAGEFLGGNDFGPPNKNSIYQILDDSSSMASPKIRYFEK